METGWNLKTFGVTWRTEKLVKHIATIEEAVFVEGGSVNEHKTNMTEIFQELAVIGDVLSEQDRVVHLLASLADAYDMLVTALEAQVETVLK